MEYWLLLRAVACVAVAAVAASSLGFAQGNAPSQGKIEVVGGTTYDWGNVKPGVLNGEVVVKNTGKGDLHILELRASCSCTGTLLADSVIKPGATATISLALTTGNSAGRIHKPLTILSTDPTNPAVKLDLTANIRQAYTIMPFEFFNVMNARIGKETMASINIISLSDSTFTLFAPELVEGNADVRFEQTTPIQIKPRGIVPVRMFVTPRKPGKIQGKVLIKTNNPEALENVIEITGTNVPAPEKSADPR
ncbi:MAG: DUF1573 domain-containing protein [Candidatus Kapabacteria bacterium]|nr:DUF1573 domain-containing protein [Candidatus Kapabacteria bacterium]